MMSYAKALLKPEEGAVGIYYEWTSNAQKNDFGGYTFCSPTFSSETLDNTKWRIMLNFSDECVLGSGYLHRCSKDGGPESIYVSSLLYIVDSKGRSDQICSIENKVFKKDQQKCFAVDFHTIVTLISLPSLSFSCELWKPGSVMTSAAKDEISSLTCAISSLWNPAPKDEESTSARSSNELKVEEFWSSKTEPVKSTGKECKVLMYAGVTVFDADSSSVIGKEEKYFTFSHEPNGERDIIRSIVNGELLKRHSASLSYDSVKAIERLVAYLKKTNFPDVQTRTQRVDASSQTDEAVIGTRSSSLSANTDDSKDLQASVLQAFRIPWITSQKSSSSSKEEEDDNFSLEGDLFRAYGNGLLSDLTVCCGDRKWPAHRAILCTRSPTMCDRLESQTDCSLLELSEDHPCVVDAVLTFCYTDALSEELLLLENAAGLYSAANRLQISPLIALSSGILEHDLSVDNACETCVLADAWGDEGLKTSVMDFICRHAAEMIRSEAWLKFMKENPSVAAEVMHYVCLQKIMK